jgi:hypothetical protein
LDYELLFEALAEIVVDVPRQMAPDYEPRRPDQH